MTRYEVKILNRVIKKTTEGSSFSIFDILYNINQGLSGGFDKGYVFNTDDTAEKLSNFLIDKDLAEKVPSDNPQFQKILQWRKEGKRLKKYGNYRVYKFMTAPLPDLIKVIGLIATILGIILVTIQIYNSCTKPKIQSMIELKGK